MINNPWYLGGRINNGGPGGLEIARKLFAKVWIGAHDEDKKNTGLGTRQTRVKKWHVEDIRKLLDDSDGKRKRASSGTGSEKSTGETTSSSPSKFAKRCGTNVIALDNGDEYIVSGK